MKRLIILAGVLFCTWSLSAQTATDETIQKNLDATRERLAAFNTEALLDSLDQEKLPRIVSGGLFGGGNISNFIITRNHVSMHSYMRIGAEAGGFLDFRITPHFAIQPQIIFTAHQNYFEANEDSIKDKTDRLWSFGAEIPIYFLGRYGNMEKGYIQFGGGIFTHFTFASNVKNYRNVEKTSTPTPIPARYKEEGDGYDYTDLYTLHNNHFGVCAMIGYECPFGMIINASYKVSFSDIATFYKQNEGQEIANALFYPQSISLVIGYRWR